MLGGLMDHADMNGLQAGTRLVYLALMAIARKPYVDNAPFIHSSLARLTALPVPQVTLALERLYEAGLFIPSQAARFSEAFYLPRAMELDLSLNPSNPHHRRHVQNRLAALSKFAPDLCALFLSDYPEWAADSQPATLTEVVNDGMESTAGKSASAD
jgi:hypothetical protein